MIDPIQISGATKYQPKVVKKINKKKSTIEDNDKVLAKFNQQYIEKFENSVSFKINLWDTQGMEQSHNLASI